jgi:hypothetical protein
MPAPHYSPEQNQQFVELQTQLDGHNKKFKSGEISGKFEISPEKLKALRIWQMHNQNAIMAGSRPPWENESRDENGRWTKTP